MALCTCALAALLAQLLARRTALAGPPFFTDDPEPVGYRHGEIYAALTAISDDIGTSGSMPGIEFNYGPSAEIQIHVVAPIVYDRPAGGAMSCGYGDTELGIVCRFVRERGWLPQVGTFPLIELSTGERSRGLGNGKTQLFLPIWLQKSWGPWTSYGGGGYWFNPGSGNKNWTFLGWEAQRTLSERLVLGAECFYRTQDRIDGRSGFGFNVGGFYNFSEGHHLLFSAGRDLHGPRRVTGYLAYQLTF